MKKLQVLLIIGLLIAVVNAYRELRDIESTSLVSSLPKNGDARSSAFSATSEKSVVPSHEFEALVEAEVEAMAQLQDRPEEVQKRLKDLAYSMQEKDVQKLQESALNTHLSGDQRFLSVYILGESTLPKAQESLELIASSPIPALKEARLTVQEEVIRSQAVESLQHPASLQRVLSQVDNSFIADRAQRNLLYREGKISSPPAQQDLKALKTLIVPGNVW